MGMVDSILSENKDKWLESMMWVLLIKYQVLYYTVTVYYDQSVVSFKVNQYKSEQNQNLYR